MHHRIAAITMLAATTALAACGGGGSGGSNGTTYTPPGGGGGGSTPAPVSTLAPLTVGIALPSGTIGAEKDPTFGLIGGYTQTTYSQTLAFPPGTTITLKNLSSSTPHTLNVLSTTGFPANPTLSTGATGGGFLGAGFSSGVIQPGSTVKVVLNNPGTYYIGCAFHYITNAMRDVIRVSASAQPGPQATPEPSGSGGGGCIGNYC